MCYIRGIDTSGVPVGTMQDFGQATLPFGFVSCNAAVVPQAGQYATLFAKIGTTYNTGGEGVGNFRLPGAIGKTKIMAGLYTDPVSGPITRVAGASHGAEKHTNTIAETPSHKHGGGAHGHGLKGGGNAIVGIGVDGQPAMGATVFNGIYNAIVADSSETIALEGGNQSHNNMQPSLVIGNMGIAYI